MLGVFLLPAFTRLGHECQDLWSGEMECMCAQTRPRFILLSERVLGESEPTLTPRGKVSWTRKILLRGGWNPERRTVSPTHYQRAIPAPLVRAELSVQSLFQLGMCLIRLSMFRSNTSLVFVLVEVRIALSLLSLEGICQSTCLAWFLLSLEGICYSQRVWRGFLP